MSLPTVMDFKELLSRSELEKQLQEARDQGDIEQAKLIGMRLAMRMLLTVLPRLRQIYRQHNFIIADHVLRGTGIIGVIGPLIADLADEFELILGEGAEVFLRRARDDLLTMATPGALLTQGLLLDSQRLLKPPPGDSSRLNATSLATVLASVSPLLVMAGDKGQTERTPPENLLSSIDNVKINAVTETTDPSVAMHWRDRVRLLPRPLIFALDSVDALLREGRPVGEARAAVQEALEAHRLGLEATLRHEVLRVHGEAEDLILESLEHAAAGYILRSRFWPTTDPAHADNDGLRWYRNNRAGSDGWWSDRIVPPYRKNCVCYTVPILESPGKEYEATWPVVPGVDAIEARSIGRWRGWFNLRQPDVQRLIVGNQLWMAAALAGGRVLYEDLVTEDGWLLTTRQLMAESLERRFARRASVIQAIDRVAAVEDRAMRNMDPTTPALEADYRAKLLRAL